MNPQALEALYSDREDLDTVALLELGLRSDSSLLQLRFDLPRFPDHPPSRWGPEANTVQVTLDCWLARGSTSTAELQLRGWAPEHEGRLVLAGAAEGLRLSFHSALLELSVRCEGARIAALSAYIRSDRPPP